MISKKTASILASVLAILLSACASGPVGPSLPDGQFVVIVKGEPEPVNRFNEFMQRQISNRMLPDCERKVPAGGEGIARGDASVVLVYQCAAASKMKGGELLEQFAKAYGNSIASLLEMRVTTSAACVARSCFGGPLRYWQQNPPCMVVC